MAGPQFGFRRQDLPWPQEGQLVNGRILMPPLNVTGRAGPRFGGQQPSLGAREMARRDSLEIGRRVIQQHRTDLLAKADPSLRLRNLTPAGGQGVGGTTPIGGIQPAKPVDWQAKLGHLRPTQTRLEVPYRGPGMVATQGRQQTRLGQMIWQHTQKQKQAQLKLPGPKRSLGPCTTTTLNRVKSAWQSLFPGSTKFTGKTPREQETLLAVAESAKNKRATGWARVPRQLRWRGVPGALAMLGIADVVEGDAFWNGSLEPGSPLQIWWSGIRRPYAGGHSAVLETYIRDKAGRVTGFVYSDQWIDYRVVRRPSKGGILNPYIVGAKLRKKLRP